MGKGLGKNIFYVVYFMCLLSNAPVYVLPFV
jgi:hypothetical protein